MRPMVPGAMVLVCLLTLMMGPSAQPRATRGLTARPELARVYDAIFDARFEDVPRLTSEACGPAPAEACSLLNAVAVWWRIQLDPFDTFRDGDFRSRVETAIAKALAWTEREPQRAEAWFYLGAAYGARVQWRVLRGERLAAARDGKRIKNALEQAVRLDPSMEDAYFGIGLYDYYADVAPATLKILRWLLLLPGGDRAKGLEEMQRARGRGQLVRSEADYQLSVVYLWYEKQPGRALEFLAALQARHPRNPHFLQRIAEIQDFYVDDTAASLRSWKTLFEAARQGQVAESTMAEASARLGMASQLDQLSQGEAALELLRALIAAAPAAPFGVVARAHLQLGLTLDHLGRRTEAAAAYRAAIAAAGRNDPIGTAARARSELRAR